MPLAVNVENLGAHRNSQSVFLLFTRDAYHALSHWERTLVGSIKLAYDDLCRVKGRMNDEGLARNIARHVLNDEPKPQLIQNSHSAALAVWDQQPNPYTAIMAGCIGC